MPLQQVIHENNLMIKEIIKENRCIPEAHDGLNNSNLNIIRTMAEEEREAWLVSVNLYDKRKPFEKAVINRNDPNYNCYNFCCSMVMDHYDMVLEEMIITRDRATYEGTRKDAAAVNAIYDYALNNGAICLIWS